MQIHTFYSGYRIINLIAILILALSYFSIVNFVNSGGCVEGCSYEFKVGILTPTVNAIPVLITILSVFLFLPSRYFKRWLQYIASWSIPLLIIITASESVYASNFMSGRNFIATVGMHIIGYLSVIFVLVLFVLGWYQRRREARSASVKR